MKYVTLSSKNQITLPKALLKQLAIKPRSKLLLKVTNGSMMVKPIKQSVVEATAGSLRKYISPEKLNIPFETVMEETRNIVAKYLATKK